MTSSQWYYNIASRSLLDAMDNDALTIQSSRRRCIRNIGMGLAAIGLGTPLMTQAATPILRKIPKSGETLPVIGLGLDLSLRDRSGTPATGDQFMKALWTQFGKP